MKEFEKKNVPQNEAARRRLIEIIEEAEQTALIYKGFDLDREFENPVFRRLVGSGVPVISAYELIHRDEVNTILVEKAVKQAEKRISGAIQSGARVKENGTSNAAASVNTFNPKNMTKEERKNIRERVRRGESVIF